MEVSVTVNGVVRSADARFRAHLARVLTERALEAATG